MDWGNVIRMKRLGFPTGLDGFATVLDTFFCQFKLFDLRKTASFLFFCCGKCGVNFWLNLLL